MKSMLVVLFLTTAFQCVLFSQTQTVFTGTPLVKISEGGIERTPEQVGARDAENLKCVINKIGNQYYWASRENRLLIRTESGAFITFVSPQGAGYVRVIRSDSKGATSTMTETEARFGYVEHMLIGLRSVTYYGAASH